MITGIHHTGLVVRDLDAAIAFYAVGAHFAVVNRFAIANTPATRQLLQVADATGEAALLRGTLGCIELFAFAANRALPDSRPAVSDAGIRHICVQGALDDVLFSRMVDAGADWHARPAGLGTGNLYAYIRDPDGNILEVEGVPWAPAGEPRAWYAHTALVTADIDRLSAFYAGVTGAPVHRRGSFGPDAKFDLVGGFKNARFHGAWLRTANAELEFWQYLEPETRAAPRRRVSDVGWNHLCFETGDLSAEIARLTADGVEFHGPAMDFGGARVAYARDPDGNVFELLQPAAQSGLTIAALSEDADARAVQQARTRHFAPAAITA